MASTDQLLLYIILVGVAFYLFLTKKRKNWPPGPPAYPIIGNLLQLDYEFHKTFLEHYKKYGPISSFKMGLHDAVILHDIKLIKEAFNSQIFSNRPPSASTEFFAGRRDGIFQAEGRLWEEQRRFARRSLKDVGFGKKRMEPMIMDEVAALTDWIAQQDGKPVNMEGRIGLAVVNAMWKIVTGQRYEHDDPRLMKILAELDIVSGAVQKGKVKAFLIAYYPKVAELFPNWSGWNLLSKLRKNRRDFFYGIIQEHKDTRIQGQPRDFIDVYLDEVESTTDPNSSFHFSTATSSLQSVMSDFFLAGADTTAVILYWAILYLIHNPAAEEKMHRELDRVVGKSRLPNLMDRNNLPYVDAFYMEVLRYSAMIPLGVEHGTTEEVKFHGFTIPKGTKVFPNIYAVHFEPKIWGDPENFRPERFLSEDGLSVRKNENLIPFSTGKRACIAIQLSNDQLFLFIAGIVQRFSVDRVEGEELPTLKPRVGPITLMPHHFLVRMKERK